MRNARVQIKNQHSMEIVNFNTTCTLDRIYTKLRNPLRDKILGFFGPGKSWGRTDLIRYIISNCESTKNKAV